MVSLQQAVLNSPWLPHAYTENRHGRKSSARQGSSRLTPYARQWRRSGSNSWQLFGVRAAGRGRMNRESDVTNLLAFSPEETAPSIAFVAAPMEIQARQKRSNARQLGKAQAQAADTAATAWDEESSVPDEKMPPIAGAVYLAVAVACLGAFLFGYHLSVVNGPLEQIQIDLGIAGNAAVAGWIVSITLAGAFFGAFTGGVLADIVGRTRTFQLNAIPLVLGTVLSATSNSVGAMLLGRALVGLGIGLSSSAVPLYISEISPTEIRGLLGSVNQLSICIGILGALVAGLPLAANPSWWRTMFWLAVIPTLALAAGMVWAPESPRWLFKQGKVEAAEVAVTRLWGKGRTAKAMEDLSRSSSEAGDSAEAGWSDMLSARYRKVVGLGAAIYLFQQFAGINAVVYYSTAVFRRVGIKSDVAASALVGLANVVGTGVASGLMDKQGRKKLLSLSFAGMAASMLVLALALSWKALEAYSGLLAVGGTVAYVLAFSLGVGPVPALLLPEIFPSRIRAKAVALSLGVHWVCNFFIGLSFLAIVNAVGINYVYLFFAAVCLLGVLFVDKFIIETKGRSLEEIERMLSRPV